MTAKSDRKSAALAFGAALWLGIGAFAALSSGGGALMQMIAYFPPLVWALPTLPVLISILARLIKKQMTRPEWCALAIGVVAFGLSLGWCFPRSGASEDPDLRVMTFNIHMDTREAPEALELVRAEKPDVIYLQENLGGSDSPASYLLNNLPEWYMTQAGDVAILSRWPLSDVSQVQQRSLPSRVVLAATVQAPRPFRAITAHWAVPQWRSGWRGYQYTQSLQQLDFEDTMSLVRESKLDVILGGDFNNPPTHHFTKLMSQVLRNAFSEQGRGPGWTFPRRVALTRIDHLYCSPSVQPIAAWVGPSAGSDHRSLFADFRWPR